MKVAFFTETFLPKVDGIVTRLTKTVKHLADYTAPRLVEYRDVLREEQPQGSVTAFADALVLERRLQNEQPTLDEALALIDDHQAQFAEHSTGLALTLQLANKLQQPNSSE